MTRFARSMLTAVATFVLLTWITATEAFAREAPPEIGPLAPRVVHTDVATFSERFTLIAVGVALGVAAAIIVAAVYAAVRRHHEATQQVTA
jgi:hypothetical protein